MPNGYRAYTADQVALLRAFARLIEGGERIGDLAARPREDVLAQAEARALDGTPHAALVEAVRAFDRERLEGLVAQQLALRGLRAFAAGGGAAAGPVGGRPLGARQDPDRRRASGQRGGAPRAQGRAPDVARQRDRWWWAPACPGERHEWGFLATLAIAQEDGWRIHYLGADLPVEEVVEAAWKLAPRGVALSGSDPGDRPRQSARARRASRQAAAADRWRSSAVAASSPTPHAARLRLPHRHRRVHAVPE